MLKQAGLQEYLIWLGTTRASGKQETDPELSFCPASKCLWTERKKQLFRWNNPELLGGVEGIRV